MVYSKGNYQEVESEIFDLSGTIEGKLREIFHKLLKIDLLIVPNVFSLPMHFPLSVALARVIEEDKIPTIARHHDFWWERERFRNSSMFAFFQRWFPPDLPSVSHCVINSLSQKELRKRTGLKAEIIGDTFDFSLKINKLDLYSENWRRDFKIRKSDIVFLQPARIVPRKRIELAIKLVKKLNDLKIILVVAGHSGDEGREYEKRLRKLCKKEAIRYRFIGNFVNSKRRLSRRRIYTLWDCFCNADFITYPTEQEGFGNQLVESVYFKKPLILTPYLVYKSDIRPLGLKAVEITPKLNPESIRQVKKLIEDRGRVKVMTEKNFTLGKKYFDYSVVERKLGKLIAGSLQRG